MLMGILRGWCEADYKNQNTWAMAGTFTAGTFTQRGYGVFVNGAVVEVCPPTAEGMEQACAAVSKEAQKYANPRVITDVAVYSHAALVTGCREPFHPAELP